MENLDSFNGLPFALTSTLLADAKGIFNGVYLYPTREILGSNDKRLLL